MGSNNKNVQIADGIYWVGFHDSSTALQCNPYLLIDHNEAVLFDPGSVLDFQYVFENLKSIIPIEQIKYVVLHHQDPDLCASVPLFEKAGAKFTIVTHWRTQTIIKYYGITSDYYLVDEHNFSLTLPSGREIQFLPTPYLHFPGAIASYDTATKTLFSSDLFGAMSNSWDLFAGEDYIERMKTFHEHYMPSNDILRPVMEMLLLMDISMIAPQHGSIIKKEISKHIKALRDLECGTFLSPVKKNLKKAGGYAGICGTVIKRYAAIYSQTDVQQALEGLDIELGDTIYEIKDYNYSGIELWEHMFENIYLKKGIKWLTVIEPLVERLSKEYELSIPRIFKSKFKNLQQESLMLKDEILELKNINERLNRAIEQTQGKITTCPITGLYNETFFKEFLKTELENNGISSKYTDACLAVIGIDNMAKLRYVYGDDEANNILLGVSYILKEMKTNNQLLFRLQGDQFACFSPGLSKADAVRKMEEIRNEIRTSEKFVDNITVSIGLVNLAELNETLSNGSVDKDLYQASMSRFRIAKIEGGNYVSSESEINLTQTKGKIMVVDNDKANQEILKLSLENLGYDVSLADDGLEAFSLAEKELPDLIVSEIMLPKIDGFVLREKLMQQSQTNGISFIIVSDLKNEDSVKRALNLGIVHYIKKPYMLYELLGIIQVILRGDNLNEY